MIYWEDISSGQTFKTATKTITKDDILEFAHQFDPQPFHLNQEAANNSIFGGLCASGWHVCALMMRLLADTFEREGIASLGSPGVPELRWRKPVYAGDTLSATLTVSSSRKSQSKPAMGILECEVDVTNQQGKSVVQMNTVLMVGREPEVNDHE
jgi:acyl dehydratase